MDTDTVISLVALVTGVVLLTQAANVAEVTICIILMVPSAIILLCHAAAWKWR